MKKCSLYLTAPSILLIGLLVVNIGDGDDERSEYPKTKKSFYYVVDEISHKKDWCAMADSCKLLAEVGYYEARGEEDIGAVAVMHVVMNRVSSDGVFRNQNDIKTVVNKKHQFSYLLDGSKDKPVNSEQMERMYVLAYDVMHNNVEDVTNGGLYYHVNFVSPYWSKHYEYTITIGNHLFYK